MLLTPDAKLSKALLAGNSLFVDGLVGSDDTGQRGRADFPFQTIYAANKASQWGDVINIAFGTGYYNDLLNIACIAGRFYNVDPNTILTSHILNAPFVSITSISGAGGSASLTASSYLFTSADVGREIVITWSGYIGGPQCYLIVSVAGTAATISDLAPGSGALAGSAYLVPGPMQTGPFMNGQSDGLWMFQRFADPSTLVLSGSDIDATAVKLLADGVTLFAPEQGTSSATANKPILVSNYATTASTSPSGLPNSGVATGLNALGRCTMVCTANLGIIASTSDVCGENNSSSVRCYLEAMSREILWGGGGSVSVPGGSWFGAVLAQNDASYGYWYLVNGGTRTSGMVAGANSAAFSGTDNYVIGGATTTSNVDVGSYAFFDGPSTQEKSSAMMNAFLNDLGLY